MSAAISDENAPNATTAEIDSLSLELGKLQREARAAQIPIVIVLDGWGAAGKGTLINGLALSLDSRGYRVVSIRPAIEQEPLYPPLHRFSVTLPEAGRITIYDRSWYRDLWANRARGKINRRELSVELSELYDFERMLTQSGTLIVKYFLQIDKDEQSKRFRKLRRNRATKWRIDTMDLHQNRHFEKWQKAAREVVLTDNPPGVTAFILCDAKDKRIAKHFVLQTLVNAIADQLRAAPTAGVDTGANGSSDKASESGADQCVVRITSDPSPLLRVDLNQRLSREDYDDELPRLQSHLHELEHLIYKKRIPVVISCEGWDAAGKGGSIRRLLAGLDPRGYDVHPISAPTPTERQHDYLWRFWTRLPKGGHIAVFDRSWYGRVLVERVEGFCSENEWKRAFQEIAAFERSLVRFGTVLIKFWYHVDSETQLGRFRDREMIECKRWKITEEDWRNRKHWADYEAAVADMLVLNHSEDCPYTVVPANDKLFARIFTLRTVIGMIEKGLARS